jgi:hypothetical protein
VGNFRYDIPLKPGVYELRLRFAEIVGDADPLGSPGRNPFDVSINGAVELGDFDVATDAGGANIADERVFTDVRPGRDGKLRIKFAGARAQVSAIEILPGLPGKMRPVRIVAAAESQYDSGGNLWMADQYYQGGTLARRNVVVTDTPDPSLYESERSGHFTYAIPVAKGRYRVTLKFANTSPAPPRPGQRSFDVHCNGEKLLSSFDVAAEAGRRNRALDKVFRNIPANAQGKVVFAFVPLTGHAFVNAIEVVSED